MRHTDRPANRREFLHHASQSAAVISAAAMGAVHALAEEKPDKVRLGIIGCGGIMTVHVKGLVERSDAASIAWLCDVDPAQVERMDKLVTRSFQPSPPKRTARYEEVIADMDVDAVIIATPHHWHAPIALAAMAAGKDCYIEKPISHVFNEGPLIIAAARKFGRVVPQGSQMRSSPVTAKAEKAAEGRHSWRSEGGSRVDGGDAHGRPAAAGWEGAAGRRL
jgi:hypothetical protein